MACSTWRLSSVGVKAWWLGPIRCELYRRVTEEIVAVDGDHRWYSPPQGYRDAEEDGSNGGRPGGNIQTHAVHRGDGAAGDVGESGSVCIEP